MYALNNLVSSRANASDGSGTRRGYLDSWPGVSARLTARWRPIAFRALPRAESSLDPERFGSAAHEVVRELAACGSRRDLVAETVTRALARRGTRNPALRRRLSGCARTWCERFAPDRTAELIGAELSLGSMRLDLVWRDHGWLWADELKTGEPAAGAYEQAERQLRAAASHFGASFRGVRVIWLEHPSASRALLVSMRTDR